MSVTVIEPGKLVRVDPDEVNADDVLEFGAALIREHGHHVGDSGDEKHGWSIHGAVGEAARRIANVSAKDADPARELRDAAAQRLRDFHFPVEPDLKQTMAPNTAEYQLNDTAADVDEVIARMLAPATGGQPAGDAVVAAIEEMNAAKQAQTQTPPPNAGGEGV